MRLSGCVFFTGKHAGRPLIEPVDARDALDELFTHSDGISEQFQKELERTGILLPIPPVRIVTITPGPGDRSFSMVNALQFVEEMQNVLPQLITAEGIFYYMNSRIQGVVGCSTEDDTRVLYESMLTLVQGHTLESRPHVSISNQYDSLTLISKGCGENQEAHLFARFLTTPIDVLVQPRDFFLYGSGFLNEAGKDDDSFFGEASQRICNAMITGDPKKMHRELDTVLDYLVGEFPRVSGVHMRAIHFCNPLEMTMVGADLIDRLFVQQFRLVQHVIEAENEAQLRETFHRKMDEIWEYALQRKQNNHGELMHNIVHFIDANLADPSLSIQTIAEAFHVHPTRLSASFRKYFGESIPGFIHQRRVSFIREQLCSTQDSVRTIGEKAGYVSIATMNRAFLKSEGLYPGQYRKKQRNNVK